MQSTTIVTDTALSTDLPADVDAAADSRRELIAGLTAAKPLISPKYFYDLAGSRLFEAITALPEYYPTRTERAIFAQHGQEIAHHIGRGSTFIDLGAGNCEKARSLFAVLQPSRYVAVDVAAEFLRVALAGLEGAFPEIRMLGVHSDLSEGVYLPDTVPRRRRLFFYPGSSIGNFAPEAAFTLLRQIHAQCGADGGLLIGVDLVKPEPVLHAAYNDACGVTAAFNLNALNHVNALLGSDFKPRQWQHVAFYNEHMSRIEMHLEARQAIHVNWPEGGRSFAAGDRIHTEYSHKYRVEGFAARLREAGFHSVRHWTDEQQLFAVLHAGA
jgi:dimethylhistidine N-methyltransferase